MVVSGNQGRSGLGLLGVLEGKVIKGCDLATQTNTCGISKTVRRMMLTTTEVLCTLMKEEEVNEEEDNEGHWNQLEFLYVWSI